MTQKLICKVSQPDTHYEIEISYGALKAPIALKEYLLENNFRCVIISDELVGDLYGKELEKFLLSFGIDVSLLTFPQGESEKRRSTKGHLEDQMLAKGLGRDTCVIALGGGVVTDVAGYVAATYCRGVPLVMIPTSLLGMVDASIGGKVGVNTQACKNMIGCIYQPKRIVIDPSTLSSLSKRELSNGFIEMIKHGLILDSKYFAFLEKHMESLKDLSPSILERAIYESCRIKKEIVELDEKEGGPRRMLNFGHTIGHALESLSEYSLSHGEAIALGILLEGHISVEIGHLSYEALDRIMYLLDASGVSLKAPETLCVEELLAGISLDKKALKGKARFVLLKEIGKAHPFDGSYCTPIDIPLIENALRWVSNALCCH